MRGRSLLPALLVACASTSPAPLPSSDHASLTLPGPMRGRGPSMAERNQQCAACHPDVAAEWQGSPHQRSDRGEAYRRAYSREPLAMCRGCHAPEADPRREPPEPLSLLGVGCVTCHLSGDTVLAAPRSQELTREIAPHPIRRVPAFAAAGACAGCHEFPFPDGALRADHALMQSTVSEHAASEHRHVPCASCHMPTRGEGRRHHGFSREDRTTALRDAIVVASRRLPQGSVEVRLELRGVGHALPTGDLFRRIEISAEAFSDEYVRVAEDARYLTRHFHPAGKSGAPRRQRHDDRLGADGQTVRLVRLPLGQAAAPLPIAWRVAYQRVAHPAGDDDDHAVVESEVTIAQGILPAHEGEPP